jgi:hypothetical protein
MKYNKLIAEFMGMTYGDPNDNSVMIQMTPQGNEVVPIESMKYHCSWDWLMPVVEKIEQVHEGVPKQLIHLSLLSTRDEVYNAVVEFINQLNN